MHEFRTSSTGSGHENTKQEQRDHTKWVERHVGRGFDVFKLEKFKFFEAKSIQQLELLNIIQVSKYFTFLVLVAQWEKRPDAFSYVL